MPEGMRICFDRILPRDLRTGPPPVPVPGERARAAFERTKLWPNGVTLRVAFLDGDPSQHELVQRFAPTWSAHGNVKFDFVKNTNPQIRVRFNPTNGSWSYIGRDGEAIPRSQETMNLGWQDEAVILHEFGHAIGLIHEHQNPVHGIRWNKDVVYRDLGGPPNNWPKATVDFNMFATYDRSQVNATDVDPKSIMLYAIPATWTLDGFSSEPNAVLSDLDKAFIGDPRNYPLKGDRVPA